MKNIAFVTALAALLLSPGSSPAQVPSVGNARLTAVHLDRPGDGNTWVLAPGYKARFGCEGMEFVPYFGARAGASFPIALRLSSVRRGERALVLDSAAAPAA